MTQISGGDLIEGFNPLNIANKFTKYHGESGPADRKFKGANNIKYVDAKVRTLPGQFTGAHSAMHRKQKVNVMDRAVDWFRDLAGGKDRISKGQKYIRGWNQWLPKIKK